MKTGLGYCMGMLMGFPPLGHTADTWSQKLDAMIAEVKNDLPYQQGDMVWQDFYRDGKQVVMVYRDVSASSNRKDFDVAELRQNLLPSLCEQGDNRRYLQAGFVYTTQILFQHSAPLSTSMALADCDAAAVQK